MNAIISIENILSFGIRLSDGAPFIFTTGRECIFILMGDYETLKEQCLLSGLFQDVSLRTTSIHKEAFIKKP